MPTLEALRSRLTEITDKILGLDKLLTALEREYSELLKESNRLHDKMNQVSCEHVWVPDKPYCLKCKLSARKGTEGY